MTKRTEFIRMGKMVVSIRNIANIGIDDDGRVFVAWSGRKSWVTAGRRERTIDSEINERMKEHAISRAAATEMAAKDGYVRGSIEDVIMAIREAEETGEIVDVKPGAWAAKERPPKKKKKGPSK